MTPPTVVRRLVLAPALVVLEVLLVALTPLILVLAAVASPFTGRGARPIRAALIALAFIARHMATILALLGLWVAAGFGRRTRSRAIQQAHYDLMRWFVKGIYDTIEGLARVHVRVTASAEAGAMLTAQDRPVVVLGRHAGEGDTLLVINELLVRHGRHPHLVMHERLRLDPVIDVLGSRLPNRFVDPRGGDTERDIAAMAAQLQPTDALVIFPEGRNFSEQNRHRAIERLTQAGHHGEAQRAKDMHHVLAPRPGGVLAALDANPDADVVVLGHAGFPTGLKEVWRDLPAHQTIDIRLWHEPAERVPTVRDEQIAWLYDWWGTLDGWVAERATLRAS
jgi:1-acyl-sn-glycerol-3-phosphate acyltransferase